MTKHILLITALVFGFLASTCLATPTVTMDSTKTLNFPAKDLSLFCHVSNTASDSFAVAWTMTSGPASVTFSASWGLHTTVTFGTTTGSYVFKCTVTDSSGSGNASVTVTVNAATAQNIFYVDPSYTGGSEDGSAAHPWSDFREGSDSAHWSTLDDALGGHNGYTAADTLVYFNSSSSYTVATGQDSIIAYRRGDTGTHRLTLDGQSKTSTGGTSPVWSDNTGTGQFLLDLSGCSTCSLSLGTPDDTPQDYITARGFAIKGKRVTWRGSHTVMEYLNLTDIKDIGATILFESSYRYNYQTMMCEFVSNSSDITIRNNTVNRGYGEGIYVDANYNDPSITGACFTSTGGDTVSDLLIESNNVRDPGYWGEEGGGIDIKSGIYNVSIRNNVIQYTHGGYGRPCGSATTTAYGIDILGRMISSTNDSNYWIENNWIHNSGCGITLASMNFATVRNNIISNIDMAGIVGWTFNPGSTPNNKRVYILNNTLYNTNSVTGSTDVAMEFYNFTDNPNIYNNILLVDPNGTITRETSTVPGMNSDYNFFAPNAKPSFEGSHSYSQSTTTGVLRDPAGGDFRLSNTSGNWPVGNGRNLIADDISRGTTVDYGSSSRPATGSWDVGAYIYHSYQ